MKLLKLSLLFLFFASQVSAQNSNSYVVAKPKVSMIPDSVTYTTDAMAVYINSHFNSKTEKVRAIYTWVTINIRYDVDNMYAINFYVKRDEIINKALKTRKGICSNYAALFDDLCNKTGLKSYMIEGYTKQKGFVDYLPHAWCAALIDSTWYMFDPTWGAGYVSKGKFYPEVNYKYFKVQPSELIKTHMPFDYLWQFSYYPVTPQQFYDDSTQEYRSAEYFNFPDSIKRYDRLPVNQQLNETCYRIEKFGIKNSLIYDRLQHLRHEIETMKQNANIFLYNSAGVDFNEGINYYNVFIEYRNKLFMPMKSDVEIKRMIDVASNKLHEAKFKVGKIKDPDDNISSLMESFNKLIDQAIIQVKEQEDFVGKYLRKSPPERKRMFYK